MLFYNYIDAIIRIVLLANNYNFFKFDYEIKYFFKNNMEKFY